MQWTRTERINSRTLERRFCACMGMTPKQYARIVRFKHSYHQLVLADTGKLTVHLDGYYDQSHFIHEFRHFLGVAPSVRLKGRMLPVTTVSDHLLRGEFALGGDQPGS